MSKNKHGANLFELAQKYGFNIEDIMDFSSNINPFGASPKALDYVRHNIDKLSIYPDPEYRNLLDTLSFYCKTKSENILLGSGATGLISAFIAYINPRKAMLVIPAYSEYEAELNKLQNSETFYHVLKKENDFLIDPDMLIDEINKNNIELLIMCSPNNPTGSVIDNEQMIHLLSNTNCHVLVDETYVEFTDMEKFSSTKLCSKFDKLFVIRSTSKFFAVPGIRLGYGISSNTGFLEHYNSFANLWGINIVASMMGEIMFGDTDFIKDCYEKISNERKYLKDSLEKLKDLKVYPTFGNFILCEIVSKKIDAGELYERLISKAAAIRNCSNFKTLDKYFFRICVLKHEQNDFLINLLNDIFIDKLSL